MAEKKATAKKATETKAAAAKKTTTVKKAAAPKARLQRFLRRRLFSVSAGSSRRANSLTKVRKLH